MPFSGNSFSPLRRAWVIFNHTPSDVIDSTQAPIRPSSIQTIVPIFSCFNTSGIVQLA
jgi:hypothetical protein